MERHMKTFKIRTTELLLAQDTYLVEAESEKEARRAFRETRGLPPNWRRIGSQHESPRVYFDEELAEGLRSLAEHWMAFLEREQGFDVCEGCESDPCMCHLPLDEDF
jgi:hypothetical protein